MRPLNLAKAAVALALFACPAAANADILPFTGTVTGVSSLVGVDPSCAPLTFRSLIDPVSGSVQQLLAPVDGCCFSRESRRYVAPGTRLSKVAGKHALRSGSLLWA